jgi:NAD(P)-dependent dehydrogenase (short-subunit alcohol dehydrogenase family)
VADSGELAGRGAVVTAGASGVGLGIAQRFLEAGAKVHLCDVDPAMIEQAQARFPALTASVADVGDPAAVEVAAEEARRVLGAIDVLVNNAGIGGPRDPLEAIELNDWQRVMNVNLNGPFYWMRAVIPEMKQRGAGVILNVSTASARTGLPNRSAYVTSKVGLLGLTHNAARELGPHGVRVNAILPGFMDNPRGRALIEAHAREHGKAVAEVEREFMSYISMRTMIQATEIGDMAVFLASDAACHVTAQQISVDGNMEWEI